MDPVDHFLPSKPNAPLQLESQRAVLHFRDESYPVDVTPTLRLQPQPRLIFSGCPESGVHPLGMLGKMFEDRRASLELRDSGDARPVILNSFSAGERSRFQASLQSGFLIAGPRIAVPRVLFHLFNFPDFLVQRDGKTFRNSLILRDKEYEIRIVPAQGFESEIATLKEEGGYSVTHWGMLEKQDARDIEIGVAQGLLRRVHVFLSFARGSWCGLSLAMGIDADGSKVWSELGDRMVDEWKSSTSWFDRHNGQALEDVFQRFADRWGDPYWRDLLSTCVYWYLRSNGPAGVDGGLILTQAALERVSWARLVDEWGLSPNGFGKLRADDRLRLLLSRMEISLDVPDRTTQLKALAAEFDWDGPAAVTEIRNELVHPSASGRLKDRKLPSGVSI